MIAWHGFPVYACRLLRAFVEKHRPAQVEVITCLDSIPYSDREVHLGQTFKECESEDGSLTWADLDLEVPDIFFIMAWSHAGYNSLARQVRANGGFTVLMTDNIFHGSIRQFAGALFFRMVLRRRFDAAFVPGKKASEFLRFLGMPVNRIWTGLYAADPRIFFDEQGPKSQEFAFVGQLIERKGIDELLQAIRDLGLVSRICFVGSGHMKSSVKASGCRVLDFMQPEALGQFLRDVKIFVLPSRLDHWGVALHEAALSGCVLVASDRTGAAFDLLLDGENGKIFRHGDWRSLRDALVWVRSQSDDWFESARKLSRDGAMRYCPDVWAATADQVIGEITS